MTKPQKYPAQRTNGLLILFVLLVIPLAYFLNIWSDEASTLYSTQNGIADALRHAADNEKQAPLYFWILSLWRTLNGSIFFARLFSVICAAAAIKIFASLTARLFDPRPAMLATAFFAFHPFLIWASLEIRVYSLVILLSVILLRLFLNAFWNDDGEVSWPARIGFLLVAVISLYTNYYLGFLLAGMFAALLVTRRSRSAAYYAAMAAAAGLLFVPWVFVINSQLAANTAGYQPPRSLFDGLQKLWRHLLTFVLPVGVFPNGDGSLILIVRVWLVRIALVALAIFGIKYRGRVSNLSLGLGTITASVFCCLLVAYFVLGPDYVEIRHAAVVFVPLVLFLASVVTDLFEQPVSQRVILGAAFVILLFFAYSTAILYPGMTKRGDWARVGTFIEQNEKPGQPIVVFTTFDALALPYHYNGQNRILPDEKFFEFEQEAEFGSVDSLRRQTDFVIAKIPADADEIWLALNEKCLTTDACIPLQNFVTANYTIEIEQDFYLEKVFLLRKKH